MAWRILEEDSEDDCVKRDEDGTEPQSQSTDPLAGVGSTSVASRDSPQGKQPSRMNSQTTALSSSSWSARLLEALVNAIEAESMDASTPANAMSALSGGYWACFRISTKKPGAHGAFEASLKQ